MSRRPSINRPNSDDHSLLSSQVSITLPLPVSAYECDPKLKGALQHFNERYESLRKISPDKLLPLEQRPHVNIHRVGPSQFRPMLALVVGGGPVGLLAALQLFIVGFSVVLLEKRVTYVRNQIITYAEYPGTEKLLKQLLSASYYHQLEQHGIIMGASIKLSDLEILLALKLHKTAEAHPDKIKIYYGHEFICDPSKPHGPLLCKSHLYAGSHGSLQHSVVARTYHIDEPDIVIGADSSRSAVRQLIGAQQYVANDQPVYAMIATFDNKHFLKDGQQHDVSSGSQLLAQMFPHKYTQFIKATAPTMMSDYLQLPLNYTAEHYENMNENDVCMWYLHDEKFVSKCEHNQSNRLNNMLFTSTGFYYMEEITHDEYVDYTRLNNDHDACMSWCVSRAKSHMRAFRCSHDTQTHEQAHIPPAIIDSLLAWDGQAMDINLYHPDLYSGIKEVDTNKGKQRVYVFLVGDSAHTTHFLTGSGFNQGVDDVTRLVTLFSTSAQDGMNMSDMKLEVRRLSVNSQPHPPSQSQSHSHGAPPHIVIPSSSSSADEPSSPPPPVELMSPLKRMISKDVKQWNEQEYKVVEQYHDQVVKKVNEHTHAHKISLCQVPSPTSVAPPSRSMHIPTIHEHEHEHEHSAAVAAAAPPARPKRVFVGSSSLGKGAAPPPAGAPHPPSASSSSSVSRSSSTSSPAQIGNMQQSHQNPLQLLFRPLLARRGIQQ